MSHIQQIVSVVAEFYFPCDYSVPSYKILLSTLTQKAILGLFLFLKPRERCERAKNLT